MDIRWAKIRSWHALRPDVYGVPTTYCGRDAEGCEQRDELPSERSCETCLRIVARINDAASV